MAKIDFMKVEQNMSSAMQHWYQKKLNQGEAVGYSEASTFFGFENPKPGPQDSVIAALANWIPESEVEGEKSDDAIIEETLSAFTPRAASEPENPPQQEVLNVAPLFILRQRL